MKNKNVTAAVALIIGVITFIFAYSIDTFMPELANEIGELKWILVGIASGIMGYAASVLLTFRMYKKNTQLAKQAKINENDERFLAIRKTATYYSWFITLFSLIIMTLIFTVLNLKVAVWITIAVLFLHIISACVLIVKFDKKM